MKKSILLIAFLITTTITFGQKEIDVMTDKFIKMYEKDTDAAFDYIFGTNKWMGKTNEGVLNVKSQIRDYSTLMGDYVGFEKIREKSLGDRLKLSVYLVHYERQPLRFIFKFYKSKDEWVLFNLKFDENIDYELDLIKKNK